MAALPTDLPGLEGHTMNVVGECLVVYGGKTSANTLNGNVFAMNLNTSEWRNLTCSVSGGQAPLPRAYHSACVVDWDLVVYGGILSVAVDNVHYNTYNVFTAADALDPITLQQSGPHRFRDPSNVSKDVTKQPEPSCAHILHLDGNATWETIPTYGSTPPPLAHHAATVYKKHMFVWGGYNVYAETAWAGAAPPGEVDPSVLYALDCATGMWKSVTLPPVPGLSRWGMAQCSLGGPMWLLSGGVSREVMGEVSTTILLNLDTLAVDVFENEAASKHNGLLPPTLPARSMHVVFRYGDTVYSFGGASNVSSSLSRRMYSFDMFTKKWAVVEQHGDLPPASYGSAAVVIAGKAVLFGGVTAKFTRMSTVYIFDIAKSTWSRVDTSFSSIIASNVRGVRPAPESATNGATRKNVNSEEYLSRGIQTDPTSLYSMPAYYFPPSGDGRVQNGPESPSARRERETNEFLESIIQSGASRSNSAANQNLSKSGTTTLNANVSQPSASYRPHRVPNWEAELDTLCVEEKRWRKSAVEEGEAMLRPLTLTVPAQRAVPTYRIDNQISSMKSTSRIGSQVPAREASGVRD